MLRHLLRLIWTRKTRNLMLSLEILLAFVVVFAIAAFATRSYQLYQLPLGFVYQDVWSVELHIPDDNMVKNDPAIFENFKRSLKALPEVQEVAFASFAPFGNSTAFTAFSDPESGAKVRTHVLEVSDDFFAVMGMPAVQGRWFSALDDGNDVRPMLVNTHFANSVFVDQSAIGKQFSDGQGKDKPKLTLKVTGVVDSYRDNGEFMAPTNYALVRYVPGVSLRVPHSLVLKLKPGTPRIFEGRLNQALKQIRNDWSFTISPLADSRSANLRAKMTPLLVLSVIAAFLLVMVGFGLFGVLWQNTTQRIPEIGLRRAVGANAGQIYRQIVAEQLLLSSFAMVVALALLLQLPLTRALGDHLSWSVFGVATLLAMAVIYLVSLLCALYPGWRASRLSPTQALHYE